MICILGCIPKLYGEQNFYKSLLCFIASWQTLTQIYCLSAFIVFTNKKKTLHLQCLFFVSFFYNPFTILVKLDFFLAAAFL